MHKLCTYIYTLCATANTPQAAKEELREVLADDGGAKLASMLDSVGLGALSEQLRELQLGQLLDTPPPGVDEAIAIAKVTRRSVTKHPSSQLAVALAWSGRS